MMLTMQFLDGHPPIDITDRPVVDHPAQYGAPAYQTTDLHVAWGDRESDLHDGDCVPRKIVMRPPRVYADKRATVSAAEITGVQAIVDHLWHHTPTIAPACEQYRAILQGIHDSSLPRHAPPHGSRPAYRIIDGHRAYIVDGEGWEAVTDVACPSCLRGTIRWHEAGYVPGYRRCDTCRRRFLATVQAGLSAPPRKGASYLRVE